MTAPAVRATLLRAVYRARWFAWRGFAPRWVFPTPSRVSCFTISVRALSYPCDMVRPLAVALGCISALGLYAGVNAVAERWGIQGGLPLWGGEFLALVLAGFVAGHLARGWHALNGALAAALYVLVLATGTMVREGQTVAQLGLAALGPIDFPLLVARDLLALVGASLGGWLASLPREESAADERHPHG